MPSNSTFQIRLARAEAPSRLTAIPSSEEPPTTTSEMPQTRPI